jgi:RHS repeat-associated protein
VTRWAVACRRFYTARDWRDARGWGSNQAFRNSRVAPISRGVLIHLCKEAAPPGGAKPNDDSPFQPAFSHIMKSLQNADWVDDNHSVLWQYDAAGRLTSMNNLLGTFGFDYVEPDKGLGRFLPADSLNRLLAIDYADGSRTEFVYDAMSRRVRVLERDEQGAVSSDKRLLWEGLGMVQERDAQLTAVKRYASHGVALADGSQWYYTRDHLGSVRQVTDEDQQVVETYTYDAYGVTSSSPSGGPNDQRLADFGYTGHYHHEKSSLHLALFRAYDAELGVWISEDPIEEDGGINLYGYVGNRSLMWVDLFGLDILLLNDPNALNGIGHNAVAIGNKEDGWEYRSFAACSAWTTKDNLDKKKLTDEELMEFLKNKEYTKALHYHSTAVGDQAALDEIEDNYNNKRYILTQRDCTNMAEDALKAANVDYVGSSGRGFPNVFFDANVDAGTGHYIPIE